MDDTYLQILEHLELWGIDREVDITDLLYTLFRTQRSIDPNEALDSLNSRIAHFVDEMHENRHIRLFKEEKTINGVTTWYVSARLTFFGKQYCIDERQNIINQSLATNSGIQATASNKQTKIFKWTAIIVFGTLILSVIS